MIYTYIMPHPHSSATMQRRRERGSVEVVRVEDSNLQGLHGYGAGGVTGARRVPAQIRPASRPAYRPTLRQSSYPRYRHRRGPARNARRQVHNPPETRIHSPATARAIASSPVLLRSSPPFPRSSLWPAASIPRISPQKGSHSCRSTLASRPPKSRSPERAGLRQGRGKQTRRTLAGRSGVRGPGPAPRFRST